MRQKSIVLSILAALSFSWSRPLYGWLEPTHELFSDYAATQSNTSRSGYLKQIGLEAGLATPLSLSRGEQLRAIEWIQWGSDREDAGFVLEAVGIPRNARSTNHFHHPLKPWSQAGLNDIVTGNSSILWAQDPSTQARASEGDWSWQKVRDYFYLGLTSPTGSEREANLAKTFRGLGHQMHLIQDAATPAHARNDAHPEEILKTNRYGDFWFESWAATGKGEAAIRSSASTPGTPDVSLLISNGGLVPITQLTDAELYNGTNPSATLAQGLAEYTNSNFFSDGPEEGTIFAADKFLSNHPHYSPYPRKSSTDLQDLIWQRKLPERITARDQVQEVGFWIAKERDGEQMPKFVKPIYYTRFFTERCRETGTCEAVLFKCFYLDHASHQEYAKKLVPRAIGYSTALLDYFFRGRMDALNVEEIRAVASNRMSGLRLSVKNKTPNETMGPTQAQPNASRFVVSYRYKASPGQSYIYGVSNNVATLDEVIQPDGVSTTTFTFTFPDNGIPLGASSLEMWLVYRGRLGGEDDAVAVKNLVEGFPVVYPNRYNYIDTPGGTNGKPQYETSGLVRQLGQTGLRLQNEAEARITEIELSVPGIEGLEVHFFINNIEITDRVWTYGNSFASTGIPNTWKMVVVGNTDPYNYYLRIRMHVRYTHIDGQKHYEYAPLQLVGDWVSGSSYHYEEPYGLKATGAAIGITCQDQYQSREYVAHSAMNLYGSYYSLNQRWGYDGRHFLNNRVQNSALETFLVDYVRLSGDRRGWTAPNPPCSHSYYAGCNYYGNVWPETGSARDNNLEEAYAHFEYYCRNEAFHICWDLKSTTLNLVTGTYRDHQVITSSWTGDFSPTGECSFPYAPYIQDVPWPNTLELSFDAPAGTELGDLIDELGLRAVWESFAPMALELNFNNNVPEWSIRPY